LTRMTSTVCNSFARSDDGGIGRVIVSQLAIAIAIASNPMIAIVRTMKETTVPISRRVLMGVTKSTHPRANRPPSNDGEA
jgi:hypothetical protein